MENRGGESFFGKLVSLFGSKKSGGAGAADAAGASASSAGIAGAGVTDIGAAADLVYGVNLECCSGRVHIAYRGVSDDRLYLAENRTSNEVKFFRPLGLRVFCSDCRKRLF